MRRLAVLATCFVLFCVSPARAEMYRWVDKDGREFFTNDRKQVPAQYQDSVSVVAQDESRVSVTGKPAGASVSSRGGAGEHRDKYGKGEEYWHRKAENLRLKLRNQQDEYDLVLRQMDDQERKQELKPRKSVVKKKKTDKLEKKKIKLEKEMAQTRRMLEVDLPDEARRADAYPGWLRE